MKYGQSLVAPSQLTATADRQSNSDEWEKADFFELLSISYEFLQFHSGDGDTEPRSGRTADGNRNIASW